MSVTRRRFTRDFKLTVVGQLEAGMPVVKLARAYEIHPAMVARWRRELRSDPEQAFSRRRDGDRQQSRVGQKIEGTNKKR